MIDRYFFCFVALLFSTSGYALAEEKGQNYPIAAGAGRLIVERTEEHLLYRQNALISLNGRTVGSLSRGQKLQLDLAPGTWRLSAQTRPSAEHVVLAVTIKENTASHVHVELDPARFPQQGGWGNLITQSLDAPNDDRQPLFRLRQVIVETPEGER